MFINPGDVADGVLVSAIGATARMMTRPRASRRTGDEMASAGWMDTEALIRGGLPGAKLRLEGLSGADVPELEMELKSDEVQGALQALLAARLTDAPETDAAHARQAVRLALGNTGTARAGLMAGSAPSPAARYAKPLSEYYDDKICALVAHLEGRVGAAGLSQIRREAFSTRIAALLGAIQRQVAALNQAGRDGRTEAEFMQVYRRQARYRHGNLQPPDFERRRRVPVEKIYVNTSVHVYVDQRTQSLAAGEPRRNVMDLAGLIDRTVLLGDPGGGKTTAANVLANFFASDVARKVPLIVTLRDYAAKEPPERSVAGHIEYTLDTLYQCPAPDGLVERLLLTGRAVVIFDGLDELLDTSRRRLVSERVEQFCSAYPLTPVLVTSRLVGYDQVRLDDEQFTCYRLGGFADDELAEYTRKWFALQDGTAPAKAEAEARAFLAESASAPDLRSNPLLLALMCILYRGAGSLPRDRAGIYAKCAELLFGKWDEQRHIHRELRAAEFVEPAIRHLAWWLFSSEDSRAAVREGALVDEATRFLHGRAFETADEARAAAREFVEFCRGRMWVLSDAGTTADGEKLYGFTHQTFLEYFTAAQLAAVSDTPEHLARILGPRVAMGEWEVVSQLATQLKDRNSDRGADRIYATLLDPSRNWARRVPLLAFLTRSLGGVRLSPTTLRILTRAALNRDLAGALGGPRYDVKSSMMALLLEHGAHHEQLIADEVSHCVTAMVASPQAATRAGALQLALEVGWAGSSDLWRQWCTEQAGRYAATITAEAVRSAALRSVALRAGVISIEQALAMPGGFSALMEDTPAVLPETHTLPYPVLLCSRLLDDIRDQKAANVFIAIGWYLRKHAATPWARTFRYDLPRPVVDLKRIPAGLRSLLGEEGMLGFSAVIYASIELAGLERWTAPPPYSLSELADLLARYANYRQLIHVSPSSLPDLPVPKAFRQVFRDWAEGRVNFVAILKEEGGGGETARFRSG